MFNLFLCIMWFLLAIINLWDWNSHRTGMDCGILMMLLAVRSFMDYEFQNIFGIKNKEIE